MRIRTFTILLLLTTSIACVSSGSLGAEVLSQGKHWCTAYLARTSGPFFRRDAEWATGGYDSGHRRESFDVRRQCLWIIRSAVPSGTNE